VQQAEAAANVFIMKFFLFWGEFSLLLLFFFHLQDKENKFN
jgi:hypothetical protein